MPRPALIALATVRARLRASEFGMTALAIGVGVLAGLCVAAMTKIVNVAHVAIFGIPFDVHLSAAERVAPLAAFGAPMLGGLVLGAIDMWLARKKAPPAVDPVEANALRGGRMSLSESLLVATQTVISNGCGASVGLEAGYAQIGAGVASYLGVRSRLRRQDLRMLVGCGAGGAIAAAFGAPLTGAFYAFELIIGAYSLANAIPVFAATLAASLTTQAIIGAPYDITAPDVAPLTFLALWRADRARSGRGGGRRRRDAGGGADRTGVPRGDPLASHSPRRRRTDGRRDGALHARRCWGPATARSGSTSIGR